MVKFLRTLFETNYPKQLRPDLFPVLSLWNKDLVIVWIFLWNAKSPTGTDFMKLLSAVHVLSVEYVKSAKEWMWPELLPSSCLWPDTPVSWRLSPAITGCKSPEADSPHAPIPKAVLLSEWGKFKISIKQIVTLQHRPWIQHYRKC